MDNNVLFRSDDHGNVACFDRSATYRFLLTRKLLPSWFGRFRSGAVTFVMLNPSTANEGKNDRTMNRCVDFGSDWGFQSLYVVNLSPLMEPDAKAMAKHRPPPEVSVPNAAFIKVGIRRSSAVVVAYGAQGATVPDVRLACDTLRVTHRSASFPCRCLQYTPARHPYHPLGINRGMDIDDLPEREPADCPW